MGLLFARIAVESELSTRAQQQTTWPLCPQCGRRYRSKGMVSRRLKTLIGPIQWSRRVGRCPGHCRGAQCVPLDTALGLSPQQRVGDGLQRLGCLLCVMMPYEPAAWVLAQWSGITVSASSLWQWVQHYGQRALSQLDAEVAAYSERGEVVPEALSETVAQLRLAISADGVMVPFRPTPKLAKGKTEWREVKVGLFVRLEPHLTRTGTTVSRLVHRRVVAHLGTIQRFGEHLRWQAARQSIETASECLWLSDGGTGFWGLFYRYFAPMQVIGILDFYHAAAHLWKAANAVFGDCATTTQHWFEHWRHQLRHGDHQAVLTQLTRLINLDHLWSPAELDALIQVQSYLQAHHRHIRYASFDDHDYPLGSGMIESTCKWLIQQRFKGVGMRWSEAGFNHLLQLRVLWVNQRFDPLFPAVTALEQSPSPK
ncbi:MAG: ISKra4 family transposase [Cyanobacteria bacterium P01_A01_bin.37]